MIEVISDVYGEKYNFHKKYFIKALKNITLDDLEKRMLTQHFYAPNHTVSAPQLGSLVGHRFEYMNLRYGKLGKKLSLALPWYIKQHIDTENEGGFPFLASGFWGIKDGNRNYYWKMHQGLAEALVYLKWVDIHITETDIIEDLPQIYMEGELQNMQVNAYERNSQARAECLRFHGFKCAVCAFDFQERYGDIGLGYIHVHHLRPLSSIGEAYQINPVEDLRPVCPNCHAMIHKRNPPYSIGELQSKLRFLS